MECPVNGCIYTLMNFDWMKFEFEDGANENIFSGNEQQKV